MIQNHKLFLDTDCPMCKLYGICFVKLKWVDSHTLTSYQKTIHQYAEKVNANKARNEIALHNQTTGKTVYGIKAFIKIFSENNRLLKLLLSFAPLQWLLYKLYSFITYNRKVIYPAAINNTENSCSPDFNLRYRSLYLILIAFITGFILNKFTFNLYLSLNIPHTWWVEYLVCFGQIIWQGSIAHLITKNKSMNYLGNMSTVSLIGGILILPFLILNHFILLSPLIMLAYFGIIVTLMLIEHIRRCRLLNLSLWLTCSWVVYRFMVLAIIISFILIQIN